MAAGSWELRGRAESFGAVAEEYDAVRPHYPDEIVAAVVVGHPPSPPAGPGPVRVLDVGTGTGILAGALLAAGAEVTATDVDAGMAEVARRRGLTVHVGPFERLDLPERFDRVTVAQAWHWIEPEAGLAAVRRLLAPGGQLWLIWNLGETDATVREATAAVYARFDQEAPGAISRGVSARAADQAVESFTAVPGARVRVLDVPWQVRHPTERYVRLVATYSDHVSLPPDVRGPLLADLAAAVDAVGGVVPIEYVTRAVVVSGLGN